MSLLRLWLLGSAAFVGGFLVYEYAPLLIPLGAVTVALSGLTWGIAALARAFDRRPPPEL